jgi:hypothetical protein
MRPARPTLGGGPGFATVDLAERSAHSNIAAYEVDLPAVKQ